MAKSRALSKHSRAARRAASPSLDLDRSLASAPRAEEPVRQRDSILAERANAGITKKKSTSKPKSRAQKLRQQKGMDRAEAVLDQLEIKKAKSFTRAKSVKARAAEWEDLNRKAAKSKFQALNDEADDDDAMVDDSASAPKTKSKPTLAVQTPVAETNADIDVDDDIS